MKPNVGPHERYVRFAIGLGTLFYANRLRTANRSYLPLAALGLAELTSAFTRFCPMNQLAGINNNEGSELIHFLEEDSATSLAHRANVWQREHGFTVEA